MSAFSVHDRLRRLRATRRLPKKPPLRLLLLLKQPPPGILSARSEASSVCFPSPILLLHQRKTSALVGHASSARCPLICVTGCLSTSAPVHTLCVSSVSHRPLLLGARAPQHLATTCSVLQRKSSVVEQRMRKSRVEENELCGRILSARRFTLSLPLSSHSPFTLASSDPRLSANSTRTHSPRISCTSMS
jgi:hypothetical protein